MLIICTELFLTGHSATGRILFLNSKTFQPKTLRCSWDKRQGNHRATHGKHPFFKKPPNSPMLLNRHGKKAENALSGSCGVAPLVIPKLGSGWRTRRQGGEVLPLHGACSRGGLCPPERSLRLSSSSSVGMFCRSAAWPTWDQIGKLCPKQSPCFHCNLRVIKMEKTTYSPTIHLPTMLPIKPHFLLPHHFTHFHILAPKHGKSSRFPTTWL